VDLSPDPDPEHEAMACGLGDATEYHVERDWREARLQRLAPVSQEMTCNFIAQNVLGLPRSY
jgi:acyl-CoA dehydrogenase